MIINKNGHSNSLRTDKEELALLQKELNSLTPDERETLEIMLQEVKDQEQGKLSSDGLMHQMGRLEYKHTPVDMKTFVMDDYYLGHSCKTLYPKWLEALTELFEGGYQECIFGGAIGAGKTFAASIGICRTLYELSCMVNPHRSFGLGNDSNISIVALSVTEMLATKVVFENIVVKIDSSPYFRENFPFEKTKKELRFPNHIWVASRATTDSSALGLNAIGGLLDEASFMPKVAAGKANDPRFAGTDRAEVIYNAIKRRMKSRFEKFGRLPGILFIMSSKSTADDFVARRINESKYDPTIFCREFCLTGDTKIPLLSGEIATLSELTDRYEGSDERFEVYSIDPETHRIAPGRAYRPRLTLKNQPIVKILLDDGGYVKSTASHPFLLRNGEYRRAGELKPGDRLMPLYRRIDRKGYEEIGQPDKNGEWIKTHRMVAFDKYGRGGWPSRGKDKKLTVIHHVNHRKRDNRTGNLVWMEWTAHQEHHRTEMDLLLAYVKTPEHRAYASKHMKEVHARPEFAKARNERGALFFQKMWADPNIREKLSAAASSRLTAFHRTDKGKQRQSERNLKRWEGKKKVTLAAIELAARQGRTAKDLAAELGCTAKAIFGALTRAGEPSYTELKRRYVCEQSESRSSKLNHQVVGIEDAGLADVYDLSVEKYENFALDAGVFVHNSLWGVKKEAYYNNTKFQVLAGNEQVPSRILDAGDADKIRPTLPENCVIVDVPGDFRPDFERDLEGSLRDLAGVATLAISPFIQRREKILSAVDKTRKHPFSTVVYDSTKGGMFRWDLMVQMTTTRRYGKRVERPLPIINPDAPRHVHIDPSYRRDSLGFCMAHVSGWRDVVRRNPDTHENYKERAPLYVVDFILRVVPPTGAEIILGDVRRMIYELVERGYLVTTVSMDTFQSVDGLQQLAQKGYKAFDISVDTSPDPYDNLKTSLYEDRVSVYEYGPLQDELRKLEQKWNSQKKRKIDHPPRGSKDTADALAGCLWTLAQGAPSSQPLAPVSGLPAKPSDEAWFEEQRHAVLGGQEGASKNTNVADYLSEYGLLPPFLPSSNGDAEDDPWGTGGRGGY